MMDSARKSTDNELELLQDFKTELDNIPESDLHDFSVGSVTVNENIVEITDSEDTPDTSCNEEMTLLQKACYFHLYEFAQEILNKHVNPNKTAGNNGTPPILLAAYDGDLPLIKLLYENRVSNRYFFKCVKILINCINNNLFNLFRQISFSWEDLEASQSSISS